LGLLYKHQAPAESSTFAADTERRERLAKEAVKDAERRLGFRPRDVSKENQGYDEILGSQHQRSVSSRVRGGSRTPGR
jgi:hypothetical protein